LNILLINYEYPPVGGGAATATAAIAEHLTFLGHKVAVLTSRFRDLKGAIREGNVQVIRCPAFRKNKDRSGIVEMFSYIVSAGLMLGSLIREYQIEASIVFFSFPCGPLGLLGVKQWNIPYVISLRGGDVPGNEETLNFMHKLLKPLRRFIYDKSVAVVANSAGLKEMSERADPFPVIVIPNGIDTSYYSPGESWNKTTGHEFIFLFVGRFRTQKNLFYLLDHFASLRRSGAGPFTLQIVGDGPQHNALHNHAIRVGIEDRLVWHGWVDKNRLLEIYRSADCFVNPSLYEGMPNVVLEAMACGLPVIASDVHGNNEVVRHGNTGLLFDLDESGSLVAALSTMMADPGRASEMGKKGRAWVVNDFSWNKVAQSYADLFLEYTSKAQQL
jgi:glycosyltransferase involved in cell wall biosynthesis